MNPKLVLAVLIVTLVSVQASAQTFNFGPFQDSSSNNLHLFEVGTVDTDKVAGSTRYGEGVGGFSTSDWLQINATTDLYLQGDMSLVVAWFRDGGGTIQRLVSAFNTTNPANADNEAYMIYSDATNRITFEIGNQIVQGAVVGTGFHYATFRKEGSTVTIRVDGAAYASGSITDAPTDTSGVFSIGCRGTATGAGTCGNPWIAGGAGTGAIYEVRVWDSAIDAVTLASVADDDAFNGTLEGSELAVYTFENTTRVVGVAPPAPAEFDQGLETFIIGIGFVTPASQLLFALILVGLAIVIAGSALKVMTPGKTKTGTITSVGVAVAIFCVIIGLVPLWMFLVSSTLAVALFQSPQTFINTFREISADTREAFTGESRGDFGEFTPTETVQVVQTTEEDRGDAEEG